MSDSPNPSPLPKNESAAPGEPGSGSSGEQFGSITRTPEMQGALDGRLLMLRRVLLTAVAMIEEIVLPVKGGEK